MARAQPVTLDRVWAAVADPEWDPSATAAVVGLDAPVTGGPATVTGGARDSDTESWLVDAPAGGFLRVSAAWDRGWSATVDGRPVPVLRADAIFRGVALHPGRHRVEFSYANPEERRGRAVAGAGLVVLVACVVVDRVWRRRRGRSLGAAHR